MRKELTPAKKERAVVCAMCSRPEVVGHERGVPAGWAYLWTDHGLLPMCGPCQRDPFHATPGTGAP